MSHWHSEPPLSTPRVCVCVCQISEVSFKSCSTPSIPFFSRRFFGGRTRACLICRVPQAWTLAVPFSAPSALCVSCTLAPAFRGPTGLGGHLFGEVIVFSTRMHVTRGLHVFLLTLSGAQCLGSPLPWGLQNV